MQFSKIGSGNAQSTIDPDKHKTQGGRSECTLPGGVFQQLYSINSARQETNYNVKRKNTTQEQGEEVDPIKKVKIENQRGAQDGVSGLDIQPGTKKDVEQNDRSFEDIDRLKQRYGSYCAEKKITQNLNDRIDNRKGPAENEVDDLYDFLVGQDVIDQHRMTSFPRELAAKFCSSDMSLDALKDEHFYGTSTANVFVRTRGHFTQLQLVQKESTQQDGHWGLKYYLCALHDAKQLSQREEFLGKFMNAMCVELGSLKIKGSHLSVKCSNSRSIDSIVGHAGSQADLKVLTVAMNRAYGYVAKEMGIAGDHLGDRRSRFGRLSNGVDTLKESETATYARQILQRASEARVDIPSAIEQVRAVRELAMITVGLDPRGDGNAAKISNVEWTQRQKNAWKFLTNNVLPEHFQDPNLGNFAKYLSGNSG